MAVRQSQKAYFSGNSGNISFDSDVLAGSAIVVTLHAYQVVETGTTITDNLGNVYTKLFWQSGGDGSLVLSLWYALNVAAGATTITVNPGGSSAYCSVAAVEATGIATTNAVNVWDTNTGTGTAVSAGPITTTQANTLLIAAMTSMAGGLVTIAPDVDYTQLQEYENGANEMHMNVQSRELASAGTDTANWTLGSSQGWIGGVVAFKAASVPQNLSAALPAYLSGQVTALEIRSPKPYQVIQRDQTGRADIPINGVYPGSTTGIEARWNGGPWTLIDASPAGGVYSGVLSNQVGGQGTLEVRLQDAPEITVSAAYVGVGDIFLCIGQSNMVGAASALESYSHGTLKAVVFANDYTWKELSDPYDSNTGQIDAVSLDSVPFGSFIPPLATAHLASQGVPCAFVPCALGGSAMESWQPASNHYDRTTLYGSASYRLAQVGGKAVLALWWQGEEDAIRATSEAQYNAWLDTLANTLASDHPGIRLMPCKLEILNDPPWNYSTTAVNNAIQTAWGDNANVVQGPDFSDMDWGGAHYNNAQIPTVISRWWALIEPLVEPQEVSAVQSAYLAGQAVSTGTQPAYLAGQAVSTGTQPAYLAGQSAPPAEITLRAVGTLGVLAVGATSFTVPAPAGIQAGDLLLMFVSVHDTGAGNLGDAPADWTEVGGSTSSPGFGWFAWKRATASEPADYTIANVADSACAVVAAYYNVVSSGDPIHAWDVRGNASGAGGADAITTTVAGCMVVAAAAVYDNLRVSTWAVSDPATLTEWFDAGTNNGSDTGIAVADGLKSSTGSTGALSYSVAFATTGMLVALLPEGGGAAVTGTLPAYAAGVDTTTGVLTAYAAGSLTATGALPAFATGMGAATGVLPAYAQGQAGLVDTLPAYAQGQAGLVGTLPAYAAGVDTTAGTLPAYAAGVDTAAAALSAFAQGQASLSVTLPAFTAGVDTATGALAAFVQAADTAAGMLPAYAAGTAQHFDNLPAYAAGVDTAAGALPAYSAGGTAVTAGLPAFATGSGNVAAATLPAYSAGVATTDALQQAYARGSLETQAVLPAFALGAAAATAVLPAFAQGQAGLAAALPAFAQGADVAQAVLPAYAQGQAGLVDTLPAYAQGAASGVTASLPAYAAGLAAAAASQAAFTTGAAAAAGALPAYAAGQIAASLPAYAAGESATRQALFKGMFRGLRRGSA